MSQFTAYSIFGGVVVFGAVLARAGSKLSARHDARRALESTYATVPAHLAEFSFWLVRHLVAIVVNPSERRDRARRAWFACCLLLLVVAIPVSTIAAAASGGSLPSHAVAVGIGGLVWTCVLETATLRERTMRLTGRELLRTRLWAWGLILFLFDLLLVLGWLAVTLGGAVIGKYCLAGAAFVAIADVISCGVGICLSAYNPYPLSET